MFGFRAASLIRSSRGYLLIVALALMLTFSVMPSFASLALAIDVQPLFDSIEDYLPIFFAILAIGGGIKIAMAIGKMIINMVADAFT